MGVESGRFYDKNATQAELIRNNRAGVVIIGGGQVGPATAFELERMGYTEPIVVLDTHSALALGASTASAECIRTAWTPRAIANQAAFSRTRIIIADHVFGKGASERLRFQPNGYLWLGTEENQEKLRATVRLMSEWGMSGISFLNQSELQKRYSWVPGQFIAGMVDETGGWFDANNFALLHAENTQNTRFFLETEGTKIVVEGGKVIGIETANGIIYTDNVVIAAGPGSRKLGKTAGIDLPIICVVKHSFSTHTRHPNIPSDAPFTIMPAPHFYFRPDGGGLFCGGGDNWFEQEDLRQFAEDISDVSTFEDPDQEAIMHARSEYPIEYLFLMDQQFSGNSFGLCEQTPRSKVGAGCYVYRYESELGGTPIKSERAIIDSSHDIEGLKFSIAHAGHGIMTAPAAANIAASHVMNKTPAVLGWEDFKLGVPIVEHELGSGL